MTVPWVAPLRALILGKEWNDDRGGIQVTYPLDAALWAPYGGFQSVLYTCMYSLLGLTVAMALGCAHAWRPNRGQKHTWQKHTWQKHMHGGILCVQSRALPTEWPTEQLSRWSASH